MGEENEGENGKVVNIFCDNLTCFQIVLNSKVSLLKVFKTSELTFNIKKMNVQIKFDDFN